jgi:hypothetical protein
MMLGSRQPFEKPETIQVNRWATLSNTSTLRAFSWTLQRRRSKEEIPTVVNIWQFSIPRLNLRFTVVNATLMETRYAPTRIQSTAGLYQIRLIRSCIQICIFRSIHHPQNTFLTEPKVKHSFKTASFLASKCQSKASHLIESESQNRTPILVANKCTIKHQQALKNRKFKLFKPKTPSHLHPNPKTSHLS